MRASFYLLLVVLASANALSTAAISDLATATTISSPDMAQSNINNGGKRYLRTDNSVEVDDVDSDEEERRVNPSSWKKLFPATEKLNSAAINAAKMSSAERAAAAALAKRKENLRLTLDKMLKDTKFADNTFKTWHKQGYLPSEIYNAYPSLKGKYRGLLGRYNKHVQNALINS